MINFNGNIVAEDSTTLTNNRAFLYGDAVFETVKIINSRVLFLEDHYFRLMASMRVLRMEIPMNFTMEHLEEQLLTLVKQNNVANSSRARITVYRNDGGYYLPHNNEVSYLIHCIALDSKEYIFNEDLYEVDLFKDYYVTKQLLSSIKSTNRILNTTASIYAHENGLANCLLLNDSKNVVEAIQGNLFLVSGSKLITPPVSEGCLNGVMRKHILSLAKTIEGLEVSEELISPFDLQKADELFITNVIKGIQPITQYRKKKFEAKVARTLFEKLNDLLAAI